MIDVTVAYAIPERQVEIPVTVENNCTLIRAIKASGLLEQFPEIELTQLKVGIWGQHALLDASLSAGDRIEVYRPLQVDPKVARRRKV